MDEREKRDKSSITSPPDKTHEATTPPGQGELDQEALEKGRERWAQLLGR
jgi:hypothetical protein